MSTRERVFGAPAVRALVLAAALAVPAATVSSVALSATASAQVVTTVPLYFDSSPHTTEGDTFALVAGAAGVVTITQVTSIDWGDGTPLDTTSGHVVGNSITASHVYSEEAATPYTVTVTGAGQQLVLDPNPECIATMTCTPVALPVALFGTTTVTVDEAKVTLHHVKPQIVPGGAFDGTVAKGSDRKSAGAPSDLSSVIDWGDGSTATTCTSCLVATAGGFDVNAAHQYTRPGIYVVSTMVSDDGANVRKKPVKSRIIVPLVVGTATSDEGSTFSGSLGSVLVPAHQQDLGAIDDGSGDVQPAISFPTIGTVTVDWGDGSENSLGSIDSNGVVSGSHTYSDEGSYTITLTATGTPVTPEVAISTTGPWVAKGTVTVSDAPLTGTAGSGNPFSATAGQSFSALLAHAADTDPTAPASDLSATVAWGDGQTTAAPLVAATGGGYTVSGSHTYGSPGTKNGTVHVVDVGGATKDVTFTVNVAASQVLGVTSPPKQPTSGVQGIVTTPNTGADLPFTTALLLVVSGGSLFAVGRRRR